MLVDIALSILMAGQAYPDPPPAISIAQQHPEMTDDQLRAIAIGQLRDKLKGNK